MKIFTLQDLQDLNPCYDPIKYLPKDWQGTVLDVLSVEDCSAADRIWVARQLVSDRVARLFACACAEESFKLQKEVDPRSIAAVDVARRFTLGQATTEELAAARSAARSAESAAWSAAWSADAAARSAESAAESAARSARSAAWSADAAARSAAWSADAAARSAESARSAAEFATRSAAWSAAWSAESAARSAEFAWSAAWSAAEKQQLEILVDLIKAYEDSPPTREKDYE